MKSLDVTPKAVQLQQGMVINAHVQVTVHNLDNNLSVTRVFPLAQGMISLASNFDVKERLLITAIRNFLRKNNFSALYQELRNEEITEDQFNTILTENPDKYTIAIRRAKDDHEVYAIDEVVSKIGYDLQEFSISDVSEMFGISEEDLESPLTKAIE